MTIQETSQIMDLLTVAYPRFYREQSADEKYNAVSLWAQMFADEPVGLIAAAVKTHIKTDRKGYPPHIGAIADVVLRLTQPEGMTELEAWGIVRKAIRGASMEAWSRELLPDGSLTEPSAIRNFDPLPDTIKRIIASPTQLAEWEKVDTDTLQTVVQSNFMRSFRAAVQQERDFAALPGDIRKMMEGGKPLLSE